jgi:2-C-methyl-D-erythritol 4-phosphate cytidylyltransferase
LREEPLLLHALRGALASGQVAHVVVVAPATHVDQACRIAESVTLGDDARRVSVVPGGADRTASVAAGLRALPDSDDVVLVHDAARALAPASLYTRVIAAVRAGHVAVVPGLPVTDTIKQVDEAGHVVATPARESLRAIQTPQGFDRRVLERAHAGGASATDDAGLVEALDLPVLVVEGDPRAVKVTTPGDVATVEALLQDDRYAGR